MVVSFVPENARFPIEVTLSGMVNSVINPQLPNAASPMLVTRSGRVILLRPSQL